MQCDQTDVFKQNDYTEPCTYASIKFTKSSQRGHFTLHLKPPYPQAQGVAGSKPDVSIATVSIGTVPTEVDRDMSSQYRNSSNWSWPWYVLGHRTPQYDLWPPHLHKFPHLDMAVHWHTCSLYIDRAARPSVMTQANTQGLPPNVRSEYIPCARVLIYEHGYRELTEH
jgi:hypothetical protein